MKRILKELLILIVLFFIGNIIISIFNNELITKMTY